MELERDGKRGKHRQREGESGQKAWPSGRRGANGRMGVAPWRERQAEEQAGWSSKQCAVSPIGMTAAAVEAPLGPGVTSLVLGHGGVCEVLVGAGAVLFYN